MGYGTRLETASQPTLWGRFAFWPCGCHTLALTCPYTPPQQVPSARFRASAPARLWALGFLDFSLAILYSPTMLPNRPTVPKPHTPAFRYGDADGAVIPHAGRYARECVLVAFEMIGGVEAMADWAQKNKTDFYTKLFPKVITKEVEVGTTEGVEDLLARLDAVDGRRAVAEEIVTLDAELVDDAGDDEGD